jgi:cytochrome c553
MPSHKLFGITTPSSRALAAAALLFCLDPLHAQPATPNASNAPNAGQLALCMACHGPQGNSQIPSIPSLAAQPKTFIENQLVLIREGIREVPQMKGLLDKVTDEDFVALAAYFAAQKPVKASTSPVNPKKCSAAPAICLTTLGKTKSPGWRGNKKSFWHSPSNSFETAQGWGATPIWPLPSLA